MLNLITNRGENVCGHAVALQSAFRTIMQSTVLFFFWLRLQSSGQGRREYHFMVPFTTINYRDRYLMSMMVKLI